MQAPPLARESARRPLVDPAALMQVRSLELRARGVMEGMWRGLHRSPYHGFSVEFTEYRPYTPGDDIRFLDWRLYARSDRDYIKKYQDETNLRCQLLVDQSRSMSYGSTGYSKADYGATLAATLASFLAAQGDAVGLTAFAGEIIEHLPARNRPGHLRRLLHGLERPAEGRQSGVGRALDQVVELVRRRGMVVLISDLLVPASECARPLAALRAAGHEVLVLQLIDPAERALSAAALGAPTRLRDLETGSLLDVDPQSARADYQRAREAHLAEIRGHCARLGIDHHLIGTDAPLARTLYDLVAERSARPRGRR